MILTGIPYFQSSKSAQYRVEIEKIYSEDFLEGIYIRLNIYDYPKRKDFSSLLKDIAASYLTGKNMSSRRIRPNEQKTLFRDYATSLEEVRNIYNKIESFNTTSAHFHDALRDVIKDSKVIGLKEMFSPYITMGDGNKSLGGIANTIFIEFLGALVEAANKAPHYINENDKASMDNEFILWWLERVSKHWPSYTEIPIALGDWHKELKSYKSPSADILYNLLSAIDGQITRANIETAIRKLNKA